MGTENLRLLTLRQLTGKTQKEFAPLLGVKQAQYSQIEKGLRAFTEQHKLALKFHFKLDPSFFDETPISYGATSLNYRRRNLSARDLAMATATFGLTEQAVTKDSGPNQLVPLTTVPVRARRCKAEIEQLAAETRALIGVPQDKVINNVTRCMQRLGILVTPLENPSLPADKVDGISTPTCRHHPFVTTLNYDAPGDRFRFSAAHELGHIMLHSAGHDGSLADREAEADMFAAAFLMPRSVFSEMLSPDLTLNGYAQIKAQWGTSIQSLVRRTFDLDIISKDRYRSLNMQISGRGWKKNEPVEVPIEPILIPTPDFLNVWSPESSSDDNSPNTTNFASVTSLHRRR
ncbi:XRE family transcriptional regulator [Corynebacterium sp. H127]|uniref:XRE family transcriptional regulator n=1 Tax=Corynebacterium sp. H127 TaxID=3133418 RepID=UPI0030A0A9A4